MSVLKIGSASGVDIFKRTTLFKGTEATLKQNFLEIRGNCGQVSQIFTGLEWECVEFARRFLTIVQGVSFEQIGSAVDMWDCPQLKDLQNHQRVHWKKFENGTDVSDGIPEVGDLVIYPKQKCHLFFDHGHVAVVSQVCSGHLHIAEQNVNCPKQNFGYTRTLSLLIEDQRCWIQDPLCEVLGWLKVPKNKSSGSVLF